MSAEGEWTAIYLRVSTEEQAREGVSIEMQRDLCEKYVELHDLVGPNGDTLIYLDEGISASTLDRPDLGRMLADIESGLISHVVVFKLDRLTRKVGDLCTLLGKLNDCDVALHGVRDKLDTGTASGRLVLHIMGAVAEWERDTIADRTRSGLAHIRSQGYHVGKPPYGWQLMKHTGPGSLLAPQYPEYHNIATARELQGKGISLAGIDRALGGSGHPQRASRILNAPLVNEMVAEGAGYRYP